MKRSPCGTVFGRPINRPSGTRSVLQPLEFLVRSYGPALGFCILAVADNAAKSWSS
jgi:hypothetical protein